MIRADFDPEAIARDYAAAAASCLPVLTDKAFFQGGFEVLVQVRQVVDLPLLCKDFILPPASCFRPGRRGPAGPRLPAGERIGAALPR